MVKFVLVGFGKTFNCKRASNMDTLPLVPVVVVVLDNVLKVMATE